MTRLTRIPALTLAVALAVASVTFGALPATGAPDDGPGFEVGTIAITPTSGNVTTDPRFLESLTVSVGAPVGFRALSDTYLYQGDTELGSISQPRTALMPQAAGTSGLDGAAASLNRTLLSNNPYLSDKKLSETAIPISSGVFELRYYYFASATAPNRVTDPYLALPMTIDIATGEWSVLPPAIDTSVSLSAGSTGSTVTLDAAIKNAATGMVDATAAGIVTFIDDSTTIVGTAPVVAGRAVLELAGVTDGEHSYRADFEPDDPYAYVGSTSGVAVVTVGTGSAATTATTTIPSGVGVLSLTGVPATVALGAATLNGSTLDASNTLTATVTDSRQLDYSGWSLTGQVGDFVSGSKVLPGRCLGWTPTVLGAPNSIAGAVVLPAPASTHGLSSISILATGAPNDIEVTTVTSLLQLKAPKNTPAGKYAAVLTLTLI